MRYLPKGNKSTNWKRYMHPNIHYITINNSQDMEATQVSTDRWMDKEDVGHTHKQSGLLLSHKKLNFVICNNTGGSRQYNAKWNTSDKEKQIPYDLTCEI